MSDMKIEESLGRKVFKILSFKYLFCILKEKNIGVFFFVNFDDYGFFFI